jgi:tetratricopeptide (TPR) repeat protein
LRLIRDTPPVSRHPADFDAYSLYLKGRYFQEKRTPEGYARAKACFEQALLRDSRYALALLGLADFYWLNAFYGFQYPKEALNHSKEFVLRAIEIDERLPEAHAILGALLGMSDCDWDAGYRSFQQALELDPNSPYVLFRYANFYLRPTGRLEEAVTVIRRTLAMDPLSVLTLWVAAYYAYANRQYDLAMEQLHAVLDLEPSFYLAYCVLGLGYVQLGKRERAIDALQKASDLCGANPFTTGLLAFGMGRAGRRTEAHTLIDTLQTQTRQSYVPAKALMFAYAGIEDWPRALDWAEQSVEDRDPMSIMNLMMEPTLDPIRSDPRYAAIFRRMNLTFPSARP